jgi:serine/threonine protein kinase
MRPVGAALQRRSFVGTPEYVSPEVVDGSVASAAVDFWSFGVLLYEMTFGHTPFAGPTMQDTFANIVSKELKFPPKHSASREVFLRPSCLF